MGLLLLGFADLHGAACPVVALDQLCCDNLEL